MSAPKNGGITLGRIAAEKARLVEEKKIKKEKPLPAISEDEKPFELPQGWDWVKLDYIAKNEKNALKAGPFGSALKKDMYVASGYKIYGQEQVISGDEDLGDYFIDEEKYLSLESCKVQAGDILVSLVGTIGKVLILSDNAVRGIINPRLVKVSLFSDIDRKYIGVVLGSQLVQDELYRKSHGSTMNVLNLGLLRELVFPLPPVKEQSKT
ncbi:restriction endonuclease subunit S [Aeromonas caviae]|uniref:restriction endonuclease subunit S n=1 Tax=Aeromonas caviae TaxID=648 RepID=UPI00214F326E|nr:restriction endonuclease subunit S [Aeromonas caviae]MCR3895642.1 restriction endonuclease subunit S [Aeromonas caviae]